MKKTSYVLDMFPYPSGEGLHMGHAKVYSASDIYSRYKRMTGYDVLHPTGFDAFGLPAEQYAIKNKVNPNISTKKNCENFLRQMKELNLSYDYDKVFSTTDPEFYRWTQWIFKQLYKKGLAFESFEPINWCPSCMTGLANEDLEDGKCERCGSVVEKKPLRQWVLRITDYADRLLDDLDTLTEWQPWVKDLQRNWIGRSEGSEIDFKIKGKDFENKFTVFTTRADTLFGCTYTVLAPEHTLVRELLDKNIITNKSEVEKYIADVKDKTDIERGAEGREKTGVKLDGVMAINPANQKEVPVYIADYVLASYGTGAIMAVPAHDARDGEFAKKYGIESIDAVVPFLTSEVGTEWTPNPEFPTERYRGVQVLIHDKSSSKFLVLNNKKGFYSFVNGTCEEGESFLDCVKREVKEETGYEIENLNKICTPYRMSYCKYWKNINTDNFVACYYAEVQVSQKSDISNEEKDKHSIEWWSEEDIKKHLLSLPENSDRHVKYLWNNFLFKNDTYSEDGVLMDSGEFNDMTSENARAKITEAVGGKVVTRYKLRDWVFARQRYWGEPFPIVFDENHKSYLVADSELPVRLPEVDSYEPTGTGESPLANISEFTDVYGYINDENEFVSADKSDAKAKLFKRETNTMPQWAGSSWYWLRFPDAHNDKEIFSKESQEKFGTVDIYVGGVEHATRHLIYGRFWHKFLYDLGLVKNIEPFKRLETVGLVLGEGGVKMSKRLGNTINPDDVIREYGSDVARMYVMFMGPFGQIGIWDSKSIAGVKRFLERVKKLESKIGSECKNQNIIHQTVKKVGEDIEGFKFNTAISQMMILVNEFEQNGLSRAEYDNLMTILSPFAPETCAAYVDKDWPAWDENKLTADEVTIVIQVNGKLRGNITAKKDSTDEKVLAAVKATDIWTKNVTAEPKKVITIKNKLVNIVI